MGTVAGVPKPVLRLNKSILELPRTIYVVSQYVVD